MSILNFGSFSRAEPKETEDKFAGVPQRIAHTFDNQSTSKDCVSFQNRKLKQKELIKTPDGPYSEKPGRTWGPQILHSMSSRDTPQHVGDQ